MTAFLQAKVNAWPSSAPRAAGDDCAPLPVLYERLRKICGRRMRSERTGHTLQGTALANEVFLRLRMDELSGSRPEQLPVRWFFAAASTAIRQVVVDHARARGCLKRGGGWRRSGTGPECCAVESSERRDAILVADELLAELSVVSPLQAQIAQMRFFCGLSFVQIAGVVGLPEHQVRREWQCAQVWLGSRPAAAGWNP